MHRVDHSLIGRRVNFSSSLAALLLALLLRMMEMHRHLDRPLIGRGVNVFSSLCSCPLSSCAW